MTMCAGTKKSRSMLLLLFNITEISHPKTNNNTKVSRRIKPARRQPNHQTPLFNTTSISRSSSIPFLWIFCSAKLNTSKQQIFTHLPRVKHTEMPQKRKREARGAHFCICAMVKGENFPLFLPPPLSVAPEPSAYTHTPTLEHTIFQPIPHYFGSDPNLLKVVWSLAKLLKILW